MSPNEPVYTDPDGIQGRLSLLGELTKIPSTPSLVPAENQLTAALAWLADHSHTFARSFCELVLDEDDEEGHKALGGCRRLGAAVQVRLPSIGAGALWADLSIAGPGRRFQLLVEVKLTSDFHTYTIKGVGTLAQPEAYLRSWQSSPSSGEAKVRRLGTLTVDGHAPASSDDWRARDVRWAEVHELLERLSDELDPEVRLVAEDLRGYLAGRVLDPVIPRGFLERGGVLARGVCEGLRPRVVDGKITGGFKPIVDYVGGYLRFTIPEGTHVQWWFLVTPAGGKYNVPGTPPCFQITSSNEPSRVAREGMLQAGFVPRKDKAGYKLLRVAIPFDQLPLDSVDDQVAEVTEWAYELLVAAGFVETSA